MYVLHVIILDVTIRLQESARENKRWYQWPLAYNIKKEKNKAGCGLFVVAYFQPAISINRLHGEPCTQLSESEEKLYFQIQLHA